ncbi:MAG: histidine phosphatase family protein [Phycisphaerae bacterium]|nr:histidine phosphatase family protein [Phycisphaerae bacterium]
MARTILLVRHGYVGDQYAGRYLGATDVPLCSKLISRLDPLTHWLAARSPASLFASPMLRARQTAERVSPAGLQPQFDDDLREIDFGRWEGLTYAEIAANATPAELAGWAAADDDFAFPGGEQLGGFRSRIRRAADRLVSLPGEAVVAVTHGGVIRQMICHLLRLDVRRYLLFDVRCATAAAIDWHDGGGALAGLNLPEGAPGETRWLA